MASIGTSSRVARSRLCELVLSRPRAHSVPTAPERWQPEVTKQAQAKKREVASHELAGSELAGSGAPRLRIDPVHMDTAFGNGIPRAG